MFNVDDIDVNKILVSKKEQHGKYNSSKYFTGYNDNDVIRPLYLELSQMTGYITKFEKNKIAMSLMVKDKNFLKITTKYGKKIERLMSIDFESKTTYGGGDDDDDDNDDDDKHIKTIIKIYKNSITTNFYNKIGSKKVPEKKYDMNVYQ